MTVLCDNCSPRNQCTAEKNREKCKYYHPQTNEEWLRSASANDVARLIATKLCELARHEYGIYDVVDYATVFEWLKEKHNESV